MTEFSQNNKFAGPEEVFGSRTSGENNYSLHPGIAVILNALLVNHLVTSLYSMVSGKEIRLAPIEN
jgi:hypothetical protein